jgi:putative ABC transport system permease protein
MLRYSFRLALRSIRRNPVLSAFMVLSLALGISTWVTARGALEGAMRDQLPGHTSLYTVSVPRPPRFADVLDPAIYDRFETAPRLAMSYREAQAFAPAATLRSTATFAGVAAVRVGTEAPTIEEIRFASRDLFAMFDLAFTRGGPWTAEHDVRGAAVVVVDEQTARELWATTDAVGRSVEIAGERFTVVGVLAGGRRDKLYDDIYLRRETERFYVPFASFRRLEIAPQVSFLGPPHGPTFADLLNSDDAFIHIWLELPDAAARAAYLGAHDEARVLPFRSFRAEAYHLHPAYRLLYLFAQVALVASAFNLVRLLLAKFSARADLTGIHRAMGASRRSIIVQFLIEAKLIGIAGGLVGLGLGAAGAAVLNALVPDRVGDAMIDGPAVLLTLALAVTIGLIAGGYAAWRATRLPPAVFLRGQ